MAGSFVLVRPREKPGAFAHSPFKQRAKLDFTASPFTYLRDERYSEADVDRCRSKSTEQHPHLRSLQPKEASLASTDHSIKRVQEPALIVRPVTVVTKTGDKKRLTVKYPTPGGVEHERSPSYVLMAPTAGAAATTTR